MNILVAVDDSEFADYVADFVSSHQWAAQSRIVILHVLPSLLPITTALPAPVIEGLETSFKDSGKALVHRVAENISKAKQTCTIEEEVVVGNCKQQILNWAQRINADVIVLGSHGRSGLQRWSLGSVSFAVAASAHCSVMIIKPARRHVSESNETANDQLVSSVPIK